MQIYFSNSLIKYFGFAKPNCWLNSRHQRNSSLKCWVSLHTKEISPWVVKKHRRQRLLWQLFSPCLPEGSSSSSHPDSRCSFPLHTRYTKTPDTNQKFPQTSHSLLNCFPACNSHKEIWHIYLDLTQDNSPRNWILQQKWRTEVAPHGAWLIHSTSATLQSGSFSVGTFAQKHHRPPPGRMLGFQNLYTHEDSIFLAK